MTSRRSSGIPFPVSWTQNSINESSGQCRISKDTDPSSVNLIALVNKLFDYFFNKDIGYLYTAALLAETGMLLLEKLGKGNGGVMTPAVALGSDLTQRILKTMDTSFELKEEELQVM